MTKLDELLAEGHAEELDCGSIRVKLSRPLPTLDAVTLRRIKAGDLRRLAKMKSLTDAERELRLVCDLGQLSEEQVDEIDVRDYGRIQAVLVGFQS